MRLEKFSNIYKSSREKRTERRTPRSRKHTKMKKSNQGIRNFFKPTQTPDKVPADRHPTNESPKTSSVEINSVVFSEPINPTVHLLSRKQHLGNRIVHVNTNGFWNMNGWITTRSKIA